MILGSLNTTGHVALLNVLISAQTMLSMNECLFIWMFNNGPIKIQGHPIAQIVTKLATRGLLLPKGEVLCYVWVV